MSTELGFGRSFPGNPELPNRFHLLSAVFHFHCFIVELVTRCGSLLCLASPIDDLSGMSECAASKIGWWIWFEPHDVVKNSKPVFEQCHANTCMNMECSRYPYGPSWLQYAEALCCPCQVELKVALNSSTAVPVALVNRNHFSSDACNAVVG